MEDFEGDVETIRHPKGDLKKLVEGFREVQDGGKIIDQLDVEHVLSNPKTCKSLRTIFAWCAKALENHSLSGEFSLQEKFHLNDGELSDVTKGQIV